MTIDLKIKVDLLEITGLIKAQTKPAFKQEWKDSHEIRPFKLTSMRSNPFVLRNGFPYVPQCLVEAATLVAGDGSYLSGDRDDAFGVAIPMHTRFIASDSTWDPIAYKWTPVQTEGINYWFEGTPSTSPILEDYSYRIGQEVFEVQGLSFTPGTYLTSSFNEGIDDAIQYTVSMAVILDTNTTSYGIMASPFDKDRIELATDMKDIYFSANGISARSVEKTAVVKRVPLYIILSVDTKSVTLHLGTSVKNYNTYKVEAPAVPVPMQFILGSTWLFGYITSKMHLLEWGLWDHALTNESDTSVDELFSAYSSIYGGK